MSPPLPSPRELAAFAAFADRLADAARAEILPRFRVGLRADNKAGHGFDPVTEADREAERAMRALIDETFPAHGVIGEEFGPKPAQGPFAWVLDPIDGTRAFIAGLPTWGVLIALTFERRPLLGVIDQPFLDERYVGFNGQAFVRARGATQPLAVRACPGLTSAVLATTDPNLFSPPEAGGFEQIRQTVRLTRFGADCYAYAMVASGSIDLVVESGLKVFDVAALIPVVEGAGGVVTDWRGAPVWGGGQVLAAGDARVHGEALGPLRRCAQDADQQDIA